jgi:hypothetical protein
MTFRIFGISAVVLCVLAIAQPSYATEPGSKECRQFGAVNHCSTQWDRRSKSCVCVGQ